MSQTANPYGLSFSTYKGGKNRMATSVYPLSVEYGIPIGQGDAVRVDLHGVEQYSAPVAPTTPYLVTPQLATLGVFVNCSWITPQGVLMSEQPYWPGLLAAGVLAGSIPYCTIADLTGNVYQVQCNGPTTYNTTSPGVGSLGILQPSS